MLPVVVVQLLWKMPLLLQTSLSVDVGISEIMWAVDYGHFGLPGQNCFTVD